MRQRVERQPFTRLLEGQLIAVGPDRCELKLGIRADLLQQHGFVHGGVISYAADNALTIATAQAMGSPVVTVEFKINYLRPVQGERKRSAAATLLWCAMVTKGCAPLRKERSVR